MEMTEEDIVYHSILKDGIVYHCVRQEQFAEEFLGNCIEATKNEYGFSEKAITKLIVDMGYTLGDIPIVSLTPRQCQDLKYAKKELETTEKKLDPFEKRRYYEIKQSISQMQKKWCKRR